MFYEIECDKTNKAINVKIGNKVVVCSGTKNKMLNPNGLSGTLYCPDYNMVCASTTWCNNIFDCIDRQSEADQDTFLFNTNKDELQEMDNLYLKVNDNLPISDNDGQFLNKKYQQYPISDNKILSKKDSDWIYKIKEEKKIIVKEEKKLENKKEVIKEDKKLENNQEQIKKEEIKEEKKNETKKDEN